MNLDLIKLKKKASVLWSPGSFVDANMLYYMYNYYFTDNTSGENLCGIKFSKYLHKYIPAPDCARHFQLISHC